MGARSSAAIRRRGFASLAAPWLCMEQMRLYVQHTHCIGSYEKFNGAHILYGQGNFHFVEYDESDGWNSGLLLMLDIKEKIEIEFIPVVINDVGIEKHQKKSRMKF